jgi:hypothetical protein
MGSRTRRSQPETTDTIDVYSLPLPMRRAYLRDREADGPQHVQKAMATIYIYACVSSDEQASIGKTSIDEQLRLCEKALASTGIPIIATWVDEGFSGVSRLRDRPVGRELVAALKPGQIVVAYRLDRFREARGSDLPISTNCGSGASGCSSLAIIGGFHRPTAASSTRSPSSTSSKVSSPRNSNAI